MSREERAGIPLSFEVVLQSDEDFVDKLKVAYEGYILGGVNQFSCQVGDNALKFAFKNDGQGNVFLVDTNDPIGPSDKKAYRAYALEKDGRIVDLIQPLSEAAIQLNNYLNEGHKSMATPVARFLYSNEAIVKDEQKQQLFMMALDDGSQEYYLVDEWDVKGEGGNGKVVKCYQIDPEDGNLMAPRVLKIFSDEYQWRDDWSQVLLKQEYEDFRSLYFARPPAQYVLSAAMVMEYFPGKEMLLMTKEIAQLNFRERVSLMQQILMGLNLVHHEHQQTGDPKSHLDIKPENIILDIQPAGEGKAAKLSASVIDFGLSESLAHDTDSQTKRWVTTAHIVPPDLFDEKLGVKTDIYMLGPIAYMLLGVESPYKTRLKKDNENAKAGWKFRYNALKSIPYDKEGLFVGFEMPMSVFLSAQMGLFLDRMMEKSYDNRPEPDEVLAFFNSLRILGEIMDRCKADNIDFPEEDEVVTEHLAHVALLAHGMANQLPRGVGSDVNQRVIRLAQLGELTGEALATVKEPEVKLSEFNQRYCAGIHHFFSEKFNSMEAVHEKIQAEPKGRVAMIYQQLLGEKEEQQAQAYKRHVKPPEPMSKKSE